MSDDERWLVIPSWHRFQHYGDRTPPWIKVYTELNSRPEWLELPLSQRGLLVTLWLEYARARYRLDGKRIRAITGLRNVYQSTKPLVDAGFVEWSASAPLAKTLGDNKGPQPDASAPEPKPPTPRTSNGELEPAGVTVDQRMLELARGWLKDHGAPATTTDDDDEPWF